MSFPIGATILLIVMTIWLIISVSVLSVDLWYYWKLRKSKIKKYVVGYKDVVEILGSNAQGVVSSKHAEIIGGEPYRLILLDDAKELYPYESNMRMLPERLLCQSSHHLR